MSELQDYILIVEDNENNIIYYYDDVTMEDSEAEFFQDSSSNDDVSEQLDSEDSDGAEDFVAQENPEVLPVNHSENLKRAHPNSVDDNPLCKKARSSLLGEKYTALRGLIEYVNRQITQLCEIVSEMQQSSNKLKCGNHSTLPEENQEAQAWAEPLGGFLKPEDYPKFQPSDSKDSALLPKIVSTCSLHLCTKPGSTATSYFKNTTTEHEKVLPPGETTLANNHDVRHCPPLLQNESMNPHTPSSFCIVSNSAMPGRVETTLQSNNPEATSTPTLLKNDINQCSAPSSAGILPNFGAERIILTEVPYSAENETRENAHRKYCPTFLGNITTSDASSSFPNDTSNFGVEKVVLIEVPEDGENVLKDSSETRYYPALLGNIVPTNVDPSSGTAVPCFVFEKVILIEVPGNAEGSQENNQQAMNCPPSFGNDSDQAAASSSASISPDFEMLEELQGNLEASTETASHAPSLGSDSDPNAFSPTDCLLCNLNMWTKGRTGVKKSSGMADCPSSVENNSDNDTHSFLYMPACFGPMPSETMNDSNLVENDSNQDNDSTPVSNNSDHVLPTEMTAEAESSAGDGADTVNGTTGLEEYNNQYSSFLLSISPTASFAYLGDPKRNVKMLNIHLSAAQRKSNPKQAARYLVRNLFPKETLIGSSVSANCRDRPRLDPNKMAAVREFLATVFPNYDLSEFGKEWKACISNVASLIRYLNSEAKRRQNNGGGCKLPGTPASADWNAGGVRVPSEGGFQFPQSLNVPETRETGNSVPNRNGIPEEMGSLSINNTIYSTEVLEYFGNPNRNIHVPSSLIHAAKSKARPEQSARFLIRHLFPEEILVRSNVYGSITQGIYALDPNRINALREFLQDAYPGFNLLENEYHWKLCVAAINSYIRVLRHDLKRFPNKSYQLPGWGPRDPSCN
ncbi:BEN domain-containing protein 2 isoform X2 [Oryctolagus cuniculus]|uniref:BEN domain-containing protein 2 isoform X2 n=1 Tax=Oryctolagus cuniculus TaxID=9986 RepID=UPI00387A5209